MIAAVRDDTNVIYYCNPNNPTGTHTPYTDVERLIDSVPDRVTIVIDEAYGEYVTAPDWSSAIPLGCATTTSSSAAPSPRSTGWPGSGSATPSAIPRCCAP